MSLTEKIFISDMAGRFLIQGLKYYYCSPNMYLASVAGGGAFGMYVGAKYVLDDTRRGTEEFKNIRLRATFSGLYCGIMGATIAPIAYLIAPPSLALYSLFVGVKRIM
jgi:hypothetical protein